MHYIKPLSLWSFVIAAQKANMYIKGSAQPDELHESFESICCPAYHLKSGKFLIQLGLLVIKYIKCLRIKKTLLPSTGNFSVSSFMIKKYLPCPTKLFLPIDLVLCFSWLFPCGHRILLVNTPLLNVLQFSETIIKFVLTQTEFFSPQFNFSSNDFSISISFVWIPF